MIIEPIRTIAVACALILSLGACSSSQETSGGEELTTPYSQTETYDMVRNGARLVLRYDSASASFVGTVENTTSATLPRVRVEVHLSNGVELGPTAPMDLSPGQRVPISLPAPGQTFATWTAHPEVGGSGESMAEDGEVDTPQDQFARAPGIIQRADSLLISSQYGETDHPQLPTFAVRSSCSGTQCTLREPVTGTTISFGLDDIADAVSGETAVLSTTTGVTVLSGRYVEDGDIYHGWGAWMEHSGFEVESATISGNIAGVDVQATLRGAVAGGDLTGSAPTGTAIWRGAMVGTPATGNRGGNQLLGDAALTFDLGRSTLGAAFTNIVDLTRREPHSVSAVRFDNIPVSGSGTFDAGVPDNRLQGGFYGPNQAEAAGVFEKSNIVGAFGAKRQ